MVYWLVTFLAANARWMRGAMLAIPTIAVWATRGLTLARTTRVLILLEFAVVSAIQWLRLPFFSRGRWVVSTTLAIAVRAGAAALPSLAAILRGRRLKFDSLLRVTIAVSLAFGLLLPSALQLRKRLRTQSLWGTPLSSDSAYYSNCWPRDFHAE